jgi:hypothetical protein
MSAPPPTDEADALFEEGRRLMDQGSLAEACPKLEKSFQLSPRLGTMLNLGSCFERRGQLARAIAIYERAATLARQQGRADREAAAREYAAKLEPKVGKLVVVLEEPSTALVTQVDGETISTRSDLVPLDPGRRRLTARSPGKAPFEVVLEVKPGATTTVTIPKLADAPTPAAPAAAPHAAPPPPPPEDSTARTVGLVAGFGAAAVGIGLGTFFGLRAKSKHDASSSECDASGCTPQGLTLIDQAKTAGNLSTAAFVAGGVALAVTLTVMLVTSKPSAKRPVAVLAF